MMQNTTPLTDVASANEPRVTIGVLAETDAQERRVAIWVSRVTSVLGLISLGLALIEWHVRSGHYRTVLAFLTIAMFAAIMHSYTFEDGA